MFLAILGANGHKKNCKNNSFLAPSEDATLKIIRESVELGIPSEKMCS